MELKETFAEILWIFPQINSHLEIGSLFSSTDRPDVVAFHDYIGAVPGRGNVFGGQSMRRTVERTFDLIRIIERKQRSRVKLSNEGARPPFTKVEEGCR